MSWHFPDGGRGHFSKCDYMQSEKSNKEILWEMGTFLVVSTEFENTYNMLLSVY